MKLSTKGRYALRAMIDLAVNSSGDSTVSLSSIAQRQHLSEAYLEQLAAKLKKSGLVVSSRGAARARMVVVFPLVTPVALEISSTTPD